jgi:hypothetical protein
MDPAGLTQAQKAEVKLETVKNGKPVRFMRLGCSLNINTGETTRPNCNIIHQYVYWNFTKETANKIAGWLNVKLVFDKVSS